MPPLYGAAFVGQGDRSPGVAKRVREWQFSDGAYWHVVPECWWDCYLTGLFEPECWWDGDLTDVH